MTNKLDQYVLYEENTNIVQMLDIYLNIYSTEDITLDHSSLHITSLEVKIRLFVLPNLIQGKDSRRKGKNTLSLLAYYCKYCVWLDSDQLISDQELAFRYHNHCKTSRL